MLVRTQIGFQAEPVITLCTEINKFLGPTISTTLMTLEVSVNRTEALPGLSEGIWGSVTSFHVKSTAGPNSALTYAKRGSHEVAPVDQSVQD